MVLTRKITRGDTGGGFKFGEQRCILEGWGKLWEDFLPGRGRPLGTDVRCLPHTESFSAHDSLSPQRR